MTQLRFFLSVVAARITAARDKAMTSSAPVDFTLALLCVTKVARARGAAPQPLNRHYRILHEGF
jgi:hypothetical protein